MVCDCLIGKEELELVLIIIVSEYYGIEVDEAV
jgi:hypothetical protein